MKFTCTFVPKYVYDSSVSCKSTLKYGYKCKGYCINLEHPYFHYVVEAQIIAY